MPFMAVPGESYVYSLVSDVRYSGALMLPHTALMLPHTALMLPHTALMLLSFS